MENQSNENKRMTRKQRTIIIVSVAVFAAICLWFGGKYNALVTAQENVHDAWAKVESQYQRRADLVPNLVETVKGYAAHESNVFESVVEARSKAMQVSFPENATEKQLAAYQKAQGELGIALKSLFALAENYPDLKASDSFRDLQTQLEGTENRIAVARNAYNTAAKDYNVLTRRFPGNIVASMFGFQKKPYFEAEEGAEKATKVSFK